MSRLNEERKKQLGCPLFFIKKFGPVQCFQGYKIGKAFKSSTQWLQQWKVIRPTNTKRYPSGSHHHAFSWPRGLNFCVYTPTATCTRIRRGNSFCKFLLITKMKLKLLSTSNQAAEVKLTSMNKSHGQQRALVKRLSRSVKWFRAENYKK